jgi:AbiV family abortive infection protein
MGIQIQLKFEQLYEAYDKSLDNAMRLHGAGINLLDEFPDISLGLFELGQEELGKSYTCLATMAVKRAEAEFWKVFWKEWKQHNLKAHRAFLYEWLNPFRLGAISSDGGRLSGLPFRREIAHEKEFSFYVNYDDKRKKFTNPFESVSRAESINRACALTGLIDTAIAVKETLDVGEKERNYRTFSIIPFRILAKFIYQQDVPGLYRKFSGISSYHNSLIARLKEAFDKGRSELNTILVKVKRDFKDA